MCGICGIASTRGTVDPGRLAAMSATLVQRGPDSDGAYLDGRVGLAARRLAIIDLATGDQPISNENGRITVVQNGELYNYRELRLELERAGHRFSTSGDTEVLVHLYEEHGERFAERLRGMFAVALWDAERGRLVLARDPYGIKPLYYRDVGGEIEFASELRALPRGEIDLDALDAFLAFNSVPGPLTIFREVRKLQAGHVLTWENGRSEIARYARPAPVPADEVRDDDEAELVEELRARLRDSVRAHLVSDVPVGVLLSGGVDSSVLAALAAEEASEPLRTFSIGFEERSFDELADARLVAERYGTQHRELVLRPDAALLLPALADAFDEPFADSSALPDVPRRAARRGGREGRALGRGRGRALRRLLHVRGRPARRARGLDRAVPPAGRRAAALVERQGELRLQGEAVRARRASASAGAAPRLEGDLLPGRAGRADRTQLTAPIRSTSCARASRRPRAPSCWRGSRTSTSARTSSTICSRRPTGRRWRTPSRHASRSSIRS